MGFRQALNKSGWLGWVLAILLLALSVYLYSRLSPSRVQYSAERMSQTVTIRDAETSEEWTMRRGEMEKLLRGREGTISEKEGLPNPKTGRLTGFPKNSEWDETIARLNKERAEVLAAPAAGGAKAPPKPAGER